MVAIRGPRNQGLADRSGIAPARSGKIVGATARKGNMEQIGENQESPSAGQTDGQTQTPPGASDASPVPDLAQVAVDAVAETEGITPNQARATNK